MLSISLRGIALILVIYLSYIQGDCPKHWASFKDSCYELVKVKETWIEAEEICKIFGSYLAELTTLEENQFAKGFVNSTNNWAESNVVWFGLNDVVTHSQWTWAMSFQNVTYTDWAPRQFNYPDQMCAGYMAELKWHDHPCNQPAHFLCERSGGTHLIG